MAKLNMTIPPTAPDEPAPTPEPDELAQAIAAAQAQLAEAAESGPLKRDPYRIMLLAFSNTLGTLHQSTLRWEQATEAVIAARTPLPPEHIEALIYRLETATQKGANAGMRAEAKRYIRTIDHALAVRIGLALGAAALAGGIIVAALGWSLSAGPFTGDKAWQDIMTFNPDPRPALASAATQTDRATGRRYYAGVSLWIDPPHAPPAK